MTIFLNLCLRLKRQSLEDRTVSLTCRALAGGTGPQPQHLVIRHNLAIEVKNITVLEFIDATGTHSADGYALRISEEIPADQFRTPSTLPKEDHLAFSNGYRRRTDWFQSHDRVRKKRERNLHTLM